MNRRDLIKAAIVAPVVGIVRPKPVTADWSKSPDWSKLVVDKRLTEYVESIVMILQNFTKSPITTERSTWGVGSDSIPCTVFYLGRLGGRFSIADKEFEDKRFRAPIPEVRWVDTIWSMNDMINDGIDYIQRFDPKYDPRNHRN